MQFLLATLAHNMKILLFFPHERLIGAAFWTKDTQGTPKAYIQVLPGTSRIGEFHTVLLALHPKDTVGSRRARLSLPCDIREARGWPP